MTDPLILTGLIFPVLLTAAGAFSALWGRYVEQRREDRRELWDYLDRAADSSVVSVYGEFHDRDDMSNAERQGEAMRRFCAFARIRGLYLYPDRNPRHRDLVTAYIESAHARRKAGMDGRQPYSEGVNP